MLIKEKITMTSLLLMLLACGEKEADTAIEEQSEQEDTSNEGSSSEE